MTRYRRGGVEPNIEDILNDPIVRLVMARDRLSIADVRRAIDAARRALAALAAPAHPGGPPDRGAQMADHRIDPSAERRTLAAAISHVEGRAGALGCHTCADLLSAAAEVLTDGEGPCPEKVEQIAAAMEEKLAQRVN